MDEENELIALRRKKLEALRAKGVEPFGAGFEVSGSIAEVREQFKEGEALRAAGRITAHRDMGKSHFLDLRDATGRIQVYLHAKEVGPELIDLFRLLDIGDFIGVEGTCFITKSGEPTLKVRSFRLLAKALRPLPEKWHGLQDIEARYRQRYLDLSPTSVPARFLKNALPLSAKRGVSSRNAASWKWRRQSCKRSLEVPRPNRSAHITRRSASISICASRWSSISNVCSSAGSTRYSKSIVIFAMKGFPGNTIPNSQCSKPIGPMPISRRWRISSKN